MTRDALGFMSHHIGDLEYLETLRALMVGLEHYRRLFRVDPELLVHDLHPDYQSTRFAARLAEEEGIPAVAVQHHHAHVAAGMADHGLGTGERVIGVALDGTGYGPDGAIWGGEFLVADYLGFERAMHLDYCPLPGGDAATRKPYRTALAWMHKAGVPWEERCPTVRAATGEERAILEQQLEMGINAPPTSSMGRLFDAAASLADICQRVTYEAQAACEFESAYDPHTRGAYPFEIRDGSIDPAPAIRALCSDRKQGAPPGTLSARFHNGVARMVLQACLLIGERHGLTRVVLSGGVWQNQVLLRQSMTLLEDAGFEVLVHRQVPANDGGLALGQAMIASARSRNQEPA